MRIIYFILFIGLIAITVLFIVANPQHITIHYIVNQANASLGTLLLAYLAIGVALGALLMSIKNLCLHHQCRKLTRQNTKLTTEIHALKKATEGT